MDTFDSGRARGFVPLSLVAWLIAVASVVLAVSVWTSSPLHEASYQKEDADRETRTLRLALSTTRGQNAALRGELDRLLAGLTHGSTTDRHLVPSGAATAGQPADSEENKEAAGRILEVISRAAAVGDDASKREAALQLMGAFQQGAQSFPALREAYLSAGDPKAKSMVLPLLMFVGGEEARDLVIDQVHSETDPELKKALTRLSVRYATPDHVAELKATYLDVLRSDDSNAEARMAALDGLRYADGDDLQEVLLEAAGDKSEPVRLAAIQALSSRPAMRQQLEDLVHNETSPRVREVGECRLLLSAGES